MLQHRGSDRKSIKDSCIASRECVNACIAAPFREPPPLENAAGRRPKETQCEYFPIVFRPSVI